MHISCSPTWPSSRFWSPGSRPRCATGSGACATASWAWIAIGAFLVLVVAACFYPRSSELPVARPHRHRREVRRVRAARAGRRADRPADGGLRAARLHARRLERRRVRARRRPVPRLADRPRLAGRLPAAVVPRPPRLRGALRASRWRSGSPRSRCPRWRVDRRLAWAAGSRRCPRPPRLGVAGRRDRPRSPPGRSPPSSPAGSLAPRRRDRRHRPRRLRRRGRLPRRRRQVVPPLRRDRPQGEADRRRDLRPADDARLLRLARLRRPPGRRRRLAGLERRVRLRAAPAAPARALPEHARDRVPVAGASVRRSRTPTSRCSPTSAIVGGVLFLAALLTPLWLAVRRLVRGPPVESLLLPAMWLLVAMGVLTAIGLVAGIPTDALLWIAAGLCAAPALARRARRLAWLPEWRRCSSPGGAGFIGSNLVRALLERGDDVRVLDNFSTGNRANLEGLDVEVVEGELRSYERVHNAVRGTEVVYHLGALGSVPRSVQDPLTSSAVNVEGTLNVLLAARDEGVRRVVFSSSSSVYGPQDELPVAGGRGARPALAVRRRQARRRALLHRVLARLPPLRERRRPLLQRLRAAAEPALAVRRRDPALHHGDRRRPSRSRSTATASSGATSPTSTTSSTGRSARRTPSASAAAIFNVAASAPASVNELADTIGAHPRQGGRPAARRRRARATSATPGPTSPPPARRSAGSRASASRKGLRRTVEFLV